MQRKRMVTLSEIREESYVGRDAATGKKIKRPAYFAGMKILLQGAFSFVSYFEKMHAQGKVYVGNDPTGFFFDLETGDMKCLCGEHFEEIGEEGCVKKEDSSLLQINEYAAPELLEALAEEKELRFDIDTDRYFMSVFLFEYFFHTGSPFEGKTMVNRCFLFPLEKEMYRVEHNMFCMDSAGDNQPVKGIQDKLIRYWNFYPEMLQKSFARAFFQGGCAPEFRPSAVDWMQLFVQMTMDDKECTCGFHGFSHQLQPQENGTRICPNCGKTFYPLCNGMDTIWLAHGQKLYECQTGRAPFQKDVVTGIVVENKQHKGLYGIKNVSQGIWKGVYPDGSTKEIGHEQGIPIWNGMQIRFETGEEWFLRLRNTEPAAVHLPEEEAESAQPPEEIVEDALSTQEPEQKEEHHE